MEKREIYNRLSVTAKMFFVNLDSETLQAMTEIIATYPVEKITLAFNKIPTLKRFPTIGEFIELINPPVQVRDEANELAGAILDAVRNRSTETLDAVCLLAIERFGGLQVLRMTEIDQLPTVRAQLRDTVQSILAMKNRSSGHEQLDYQKQTRQALESREQAPLKRISDTLSSVLTQITK